MEKKAIGYVVNSPTANCQLSSYRSFESFLKYFFEKDYTNIERDTIIKARSALKEIVYKTSGKSCLLIDVEEKYVELIKKVFHDAILLEQSYLSTNASKMCLFILKIRIL